MYLIYNYELWRAYVKEEVYSKLKNECPLFKVAIEKRGKMLNVSVGDTKIPEYPKDVSIKIKEGWSLVFYKETTITLEKGMIRMEYDCQKKIFGKPYEHYEID